MKATTLQSETKRLQHAARGLRRGLQAVQARSRRSRALERGEVGGAASTFETEAELRRARQKREHARVRREHALAFLRNAALLALDFERARLETERALAREKLLRRAELVADAIAAEAEGALRAVHEQLDATRLAEEEEHRDQVGVRVEFWTLEVQCRVIVFCPAACVPVGAARVDSP